MKTILKIGIIGVSIFLLAFKDYREKLLPATPVLDLPVKGISNIEVAPLTVPHMILSIDLVIWVNINLVNEHLEA